MTELLGANPGAPFLFIGSGFSRRYVGLEQWAELLGKFCADIKEFGYYHSKNNGDLAQAASDIAVDFNEVWWSSEKYSNSRGAYREHIKTSSSALKYEISNYLIHRSHSGETISGLEAEIAALSRLNVDGIITTNWDLFLEELFPDYKVYIGQEELLFSNTQSIAEIYKIHGCSSQPDSLILTHEDYEQFDAKNAYLAAKLITIFIEHPVIFIGYSLGDRNIQKIICSIVDCLGQEKLDAFGKNLIFVQRLKGTEQPSVQSALMNIRETNLSITVVKTNDFLEIYDAIETRKRKIPARILRYCKEQMYDLVKSSNPQSKLAVWDIDQIEEKDDVEFVVGVGVKDIMDRITRKGYTTIGLHEIFIDLLIEDSIYEAEELLVGVYPALLKKGSNKYIPAYKYLRRANINSNSDLALSKHAGLEPLLKRSKGLKSATYKRQYELAYAGKSTQEIVDTTPPEKAAIIIEYQDHSEIDLEVVRCFLVANKEKFRSELSPYATFFRRLGCLYDRLRYGF